MLDWFASNEEGFGMDANKVKMHQNNVMVYSGGRIMTIYRNELSCIYIFAIF